MRKLSALLVLVVIVGIPALCLAEDIYVSQASAGGDTGADCGNAHSVAWFNTLANWGSEVGKIGGGDTVRLCGTITSSLVVQTSGSAGNPITIRFQDGARLTQASCGVGCLQTNGKTYVVIDGGTNGTIEATNMGTGKAKTQSTAINAMSCSNCEVKNVHIHDMYVRTSNTDVTGVDATIFDAIRFSGSNVSVHDNTIHDVGWAIRNIYATNDTNVRVYNNDISKCAHTYALAASGGVTTAGSFYYYGNYVHDFANWDSSGCAVAHTSAIHAYGIGGSKITGTLWIYNNRFVGTGSCMTADIFLEGGTDAWTDASGTAKIFNNYITATGYVTGLVQPNKGTNHEIYNNTIIGDGGSSTICLIVGGTSTNVKVMNNFIGSCAFLMNVYATQTVDPGLVLDYNVFSNCSGYNCFWVGSTATGSFATYRTKFPGFDAHSKDSTSTTGGLINGLPQPGSPVIDAGFNLTSLGISALAQDIAGKNRPLTSPWTIGAYNATTAVTAPVNLHAY
jgi:hypothetical protein